VGQQLKRVLRGGRKGKLLIHGEGGVRGGHSPTDGKGQKKRSIERERRRGKENVEKNHDTRRKNKRFVWEIRKKRKEGFVSDNMRPGKGCGGENLEGEGSSK